MQVNRLFLFPFFHWRVMPSGFFRENQGLGGGEERGAAYNA
ncbi:hypothetical protein ACU6VJ_12485 [Sphaerotilus sulfidivorans]|jgi:hypothetical protein